MEKLYVIFATSKGKVRKNSLEDFISIQSTGKIAMKLDGDDKIIGVEICREDQNIILSTKLGKCIRFMSKKLRIFKGRSSKGIKGIELATNDEVISLSVLNGVNISPKVAKNLLKNGSTDKTKRSEIIAKQKYILSLTENGEYLFKTAREVISKLKDVESTIMDKKDKPSGKLTVTTVVSFGTTWLTPRIQEFMKLNPEIEIELIFDDKELDLSTRQADIGIWMRRPKQLNYIQKKLIDIN